jgi:hypothetical protein
MNIRYMFASFCKEVRALVPYFETELGVNELGKSNLSQIQCGPRFRDVRKETIWAIPFKKINPISCNER